MLGEILEVVSPCDGSCREEKLALQEEVVRDRQAQFYDAALRFNLPCLIEEQRIRARLRKGNAGAVFEVGCGTGRYTVDLARTNHQVVALDRSLASLQLCAQRLSEAGLRDRVLLLKADVNRAPIRGGAFDLAFSAQVIQHLPGADLRRSAVALMAHSLRDQGRLIFSGYQCTPFRAKEGFHRGGIPYFRFHRSDLCGLLGEFFHLDECLSCAGQLLLATGTVLPQNKG